MTYRSSRGFVVALVIALLISMGGMSRVAQAAFNKKVVPVCIDDLCFPIAITPDYFVKVADFNNDGRLDLYVTGHASRRFVPDFVLYQNTLESFSINAVPTASEVAAARNVPISPITVSRMELNADKYYDFYFRNVAEAIPGASDIIVTLARGTGGLPTHVVPVTDKFASLVEGYAGFLAAADKWVAATEGPICQPPFSVGLPSVWDRIVRYPTFTWEPYFSTVDAASMTLGSGSSGYYISFSSFFQPVGPKCIPRILMVKPEYRSFVQNMLTASKNDDVTNNADIWSLPWCNGIFARYGRECRDRYLYQGVMAGEIVVGAAIIIAVLYYTGQVSSDQLRDLVDVIESIGNDGWSGSIPIPPGVTPANQADVGPGVGAVPVPGADKYVSQMNCNHGPSSSHPNRGPTVEGSSKTLGKNLENQGCGCPAGSDAHHILPKADGNNFPGPLRTKIRQCLDNAGIDVDHPANGVCLPQKKDPNSKAVVHGSANGKTYWTSVAQLCEDAYNDSGPQGVRDMLDKAREHLVNGNRWWKPGGAPFWP